MSLLFLLLPVCVSAAAVLYVPSLSYPTLNDATVAAKDGDIVQIQSSIVVCGPNSAGAVVSDKSISIVGERGNMVVDCGYMGRAITATSSSGVVLSITIEGIHFSRGRSLRGGGIVLVEGDQLGTVVIKNCTFSSNIAEGALDISQSIFLGGGALMVSSLSSLPSVFQPPNITVSDCVFTNNSSPLGFGGGVFLFFNGTARDVSVDVAGRSFVANSAWSGGAVCVYFHAAVMSPLLVIGGNNSSFVNNSAIGHHHSATTVGGGAIHVCFHAFAASASLAIGGSHSSFLGNMAAAGDGGATYVSFDAAADSATLVIGGDASTFVRNSAARGGAVFVQFSAAAVHLSLLIGSSRADFGENSAVGGFGGGGAIFVALDGAVSSASMLIGGSKSSFASNFAYAASDGGGAVLVVFTAEVNSTALVIGGDASSFVNNSVFGDACGAAIALRCEETVTNISLLIGGRHSSFIDNVVSGLATGGAINVFLRGAATSTSLVIGDDASSFFNNYVLNDLGAGAIYLCFGATSTNTSLIIGADSSCFCNNSAPNGADGGAIAVWFTKAATSTSIVIGDSRSSFVNNSASLGGGAIYVLFMAETSDTWMMIGGSHSSFVGNSASLGGGGAIYVSFWGTAIATSLVIGGNTASFINNSARLSGGGAILVYFLAPVTDTSLLISGQGSASMNNSAPVGGAVNVRFIAAAINTWISIGGTSSSFVKNSALGVGGAICVEFNAAAASSLLVLGGSDSSFVRNSAGSGGGAIYLVFSEETNYTSAVVGDDSSVFDSNSAGSQGSGGAVYLALSAARNTSIYSMSCTFSNNAAKTGGAILTQISDAADPLSVELSVSGCRFLKNDGGGVVLMLPSDATDTDRCAVCTSLSGHDIPPMNCGYAAFDREICSNVNHGIQNAFVPFFPRVSVFLSNSSFENNTGALQGGGLFIANGFIQMSNLNFCNNHAIQDGGAMFITGTAQVRVADRILLRRNDAATDTSFAIASSGYLHVDSEIIVEASPPPSETPSNFVAVLVQGIGEMSIGARANLSVYCPAGYVHISPPSSGTFSRFYNQFPNAMLSTTWSASCSPCPSGTYAIHAGYVDLVNSSAPPYWSERMDSNGGQCMACPFGGNCDGGVNNVSVSHNYWSTMMVRGTHSNSNNSSNNNNSNKNVAAWGFTECAPGYCCQDPGGCSLLGDGSSLCAFGRNVSIPLCGGCLKDHSQSMTTLECVPMDKCDEDLRWVWIIFFLLVLLFSVWLFYSSSRDSSRPPTGDVESSWVIPTLSFFYQNLSLVYEASGYSSTDVGAAILSLSSGFRNALTSTSSSASNLSASRYSICAVRDLSTAGSIGFKLIFFPAVAVVCSLVWLSCRTIFYRAPFARTIAVKGVFASVLVKLMLLGYTSLVSVVSTLLHCVPVSDDRRSFVIHKAGEVECYTGWQMLLWVVFAVVIVPAPALFIVMHRFWRIHRRECGGGDSAQQDTPCTFSVGTEPLMGGEKMPQSRVGGAARHRSWFPSFLASSVNFQAAEQPYSSSRWYWGSFTLLRRLLVSLVFAFVTDKSVQAMLFCFLFILFFGFQTAVSPFQSRFGNVVEIVSLMCLALTSLSALRTGTILETTTNVKPDTLPYIVTDNLVILQDILFFLPLLLTISFVALSWLLQRSSWAMGCLEKTRQVWEERVTRFAVWFSQTE